MSDLPPAAPAAGLPALPYSPGDRPQFLSAMLAELVRTDTADGQPFGLTTRVLDDPTVALLDAWATVADVIAFYQERIANEGFVGTATQPGSLLAIAQLTGYQPRPGLAASLWLAYSLQPDPTDTAVVLPAGLLAQSVPGTGELPQTFETTEELVARPSWNTLGVQTTGPVLVPTSPGGVADLTSLSFQGATTGLVANDVILLTDSDNNMTPVTVQTVTVDLANQITTVTLQPPTVAGAAVMTAAAMLAMPTTPTPAAAAPAKAPTGVDNPGTPITRAIDHALTRLNAVPPAPPASTPALNRGPGEVFPMGSHTTTNDNVVRLVAALNPRLAGTVYKALGTTPIGPATVNEAQAMQVQATPFGVRMPPRPVFNSQGQQTGTEELPIGDMQTLSAQMTVSSGQPSGTAQVTIEGPGGVSATAAINAADLSTSENPLGALGNVAIAQASPASPPGTHTTGTTTTTITFSPAPTAALMGTMAIGLTPATDESGNGSGTVDVTIEFRHGSSAPEPGDSNGFTWVPLLQASQHFTLGNQRITIGWQPAPATTTANGPAEALLYVSVAQALPLADPTVLDLDAVYPGILQGSSIVVDGPPPAAGTTDTAGTGATAGTAGTTGATGPTYPLVATVTKVTTTAISRYGMSGTVTELTLSTNWIDPDARWLSSVRPVTIQAQPAVLTLLAVALLTPVAGNTIELDRLYAGIQAGQRILVAGTRVDVPGGATVPGGEPAMVFGVSQTAAGVGDAPHTTLLLATHLTYSYDLATVQIFGNAVPAHQGATLNEPLLGAKPGDQNPLFTLSQAPVLADPSTAASGYATTLQLTVNGIVWNPVTRLDTATPAHSYLTGIDSQGRTTIMLSGPLPTGTSNVVATYRAGQGSAGNVRASQVTQLLSRPLTVASVVNPLPGSGGSDGDGPANLQAGASLGLTTMGRIVTIADATDLALAWSGVARAGAAPATDGRSEVVTLTVAGVDPVVLNPAGIVITGLAAALAANGDPSAPVIVVPANLYLIVLAAVVLCDPALDWTNVSNDLQAALFTALGYARRRIGEDVVISEILAVAHTVVGVDSFSVTGIAFIATTASATDIYQATTRLPSPPANGRVVLPTPPVPASGPTAQALAFLSNAVTDTLILQQVSQ